MIGWLIDCLPQLLRLNDLGEFNSAAGLVTVTGRCCGTIFRATVDLASRCPASCG